MSKALDYLIFLNAALTVVMTLVVIYAIWFPDPVYDGFTWKILGSYTVIIINMIVLFKIKDVYKNEHEKHITEKDSHD